MVCLAVTLGDYLHVVLRFVVRWYSVVLINRTLAGVVAREREFDISGKPLQQPAQIFRTRSNVLDRIVWIFTTKTFRCRRYQLHQALRTRVRECLRLVFRLLPDDRMNEPRIHTLLLTGFENNAVQIRISGSGNVCWN